MISINKTVGRWNARIQILQVGLAKGSQHAYDITLLQPSCEDLACYKSDNEQVPVIPEFKRTIADVKCTDAQGRVFIVEMQMNWTDHFKQRLLFGTSQAFVKQLVKGEEYKFLQPVYGLGIVAEIYEKTTPDWYHHYQLVKKGDTSHSDLIEHLQLIFIELPKFPIQSPEEKQLRLLWLRFLREIDEKTTTVSKDLLEVPEIAQALELAEESAYTPGELKLYESYWDQVSREKTLIMNKYAEGLAEGESRGIEKIAINMLRANKSVDEIILFTGLSEQSITELQNKIK
jgi:predicted transposase/invertase (TIGR01784 family)